MTSAQRSSLPPGAKRIKYRLVSIGGIVGRHLSLERVLLSFLFAMVLSFALAVTRTQASGPDIMR